MKTEALLLDMDSFVPAWKDQWEPAPGMLDFTEKWKSFHTPGGRLMVCAHRGDHNIFYPENSLEGCFSAILAGADMLEVDVHTTADGHLVIMHDDTLTRTTNLSLLRQSGENWMPESDDIRRWTLEQIRRLRLCAVDGQITEYAVPTLREIISIAKGRVFLTLDKTNAFSWEAAYGLIEEQQAFSTVLIPYNYPLKEVAEIRRGMLRRHGECCPFFAGVVVGNGCWSEEKIREAVAFLKESDMPPVLRGGYYNPGDEERLGPLMQELTKTHRVYAEAMGERRDTPENWEAMLKMGYGIFMGNRLYDLLRLVKQRHFS